MLAEIDKKANKPKTLKWSKFLHFWKVEVLSSYHIKFNFSIQA